MDGIRQYLMVLEGIGWCWMGWYWMVLGISQSAPCVVAVAWPTKTTYNPGNVLGYSQIQKTLKCIIGDTQKGHTICVSPDHAEDLKR